MSDERGVELQKWCPPHWDQLRLAIQDRGLSHLVSQGGERAAAQVVTELQMGTAHDVEGFDPLLRAFFMINGRALDVGLNIVGCPLCQLTEHASTCTTPGCQAPKPEDWVNECTDSLREYAKTLGLVV